MLNELKKLCWCVQQILEREQGIVLTAAAVGGKDVDLS